MRHFYWIVFLGILLGSSGEVQAQVGSAGRSISKIKIQHRLEETYLQACKAQERYPISFWSGPTKGFSNSGYSLAGDIYKPYASSSEQMADYFLIRNNILMKRWMPVLHEQARTVRSRLGEFYQSREIISVPEGEEVSWLATQIPSETKYLLMGEVHLPEIAQAVEKFAPLLREKYPQREIIWFTEFISEKGEIRKQRYTEVKEAVEKAGMEIVGLEPAFVEENLQNFFIYRQKLPDDTFYREKEDNMWASLEGVRLRNQYWVDTLNRYRQQHPDALFVVYAGSGHLEYTVPYSLGKRLPKEETFTVVFYPDHIWDIDLGQDTISTSPFDDVTFGKFALEQILRFNSKELSRLAGFDVQIKIPLAGEE